MLAFNVAQVGLADVTARQATAKNREVLCAELGRLERRLRLNARPSWSGSPRDRAKSDTSR